MGSLQTLSVLLVFLAPAELKADIQPGSMPKLISERKSDSKPQIYPELTSELLPEPAGATVGPRAGAESAFPVKWETEAGLRSDPQTMSPPGFNTVWALEPEEVNPGAVAVEPGAASVDKGNKIGFIYDTIRRRERHHALFQEEKSLYADYTRFKQQLNQEMGLSWSVDLSTLPQWGWPDGGSPSVQVLSTSALEWTVLKQKRWGEGSLQVLSIAARYPGGRNALAVSDGVGLITPINDYPYDQNIFAQLSYTQAFPGNKVLITIGQYPFFNFDGNQYLFNQQVNFNSYIFSQNGSSTYANAGLGAYAQVNLTDALQVATGLQSANNLSGSTLSTRNFSEAGYSWFAYAQWTPKFKGLGAAQYSFTYYALPSVSTQLASRGWSVNAVQNLNNTWALFARANQAYGGLTPIRGSFALGAAINNPLGRNATDQIGFALGISTASPQPINPAGARDETVVEAYWSWSVLGGLLLTPSVQFVVDPALARDRDSAWALSLRATLML